MDTKFKIKVIETEYDRPFLESVLESLELDIQDIDAWDVYNGDQLNEEIHVLRTILKEIKKKVGDNK